MSKKKVSLLEFAQPLVKMIEQLDEFEKKDKDFKAQMDRFREYQNKKSQR